MSARRGARGHRHRFPAGHRHGGDVGHTADSRRGGCHRHRGAREAQRLRRQARRRQRALLRPHFLDAEHQHLPRPALGPRPGNLRRRPVPDRAARRGVHPWLAGRRSELHQGDGVRETFCRPQRAGTVAAHIRCRAARTRFLRNISAAIRGRRARRPRRRGDGRLQFGLWRAGLREPAAAHGPFAQGSGASTGHVVSDCGAINDIYANHKFAGFARGGGGGRGEGRRRFVLRDGLQFTDARGQGRFDFGKGN